MFGPLMQAGKATEAGKGERKGEICTQYRAPSHLLHGKAIWGRATSWWCIFMVLRGLKMLKAREHRVETGREGAEGVGPGLRDGHMHGCKLVLSSDHCS